MLRAGGEQGLRTLRPLGWRGRSGPGLVQLEDRGDVVVPDDLPLSRVVRVLADILVRELQDAA